MPESLINIDIFIQETVHCLGKNTICAYCLGAIPPKTR